MVAIRTKIFETRPPDVARDAWREIAREGMRAVAEFWHELILPDHFTPQARFRYRHKLRRRRYVERKQKKAAQGLPIQKGSGPILMGGQVDNVLTGYLMQQVRQHKAIRAFPTRVTLEMFGPRYITMRNWKMDQPNKGKELTTLTAEQNRECAIVAEKKVNELLAKYRAPKTTTI